ncbi:hypothetical protein [Desulfovibrio sp. ZJ200]|uniref:hypothetical protein n=1 Tax=Desulfovibrio sp. ZJ200 TaxID=2709792 RepID=UPI0013ED1254|nr:hypothetical protein [Desulfovibrio sp. ZJ200]
MSRESEANSRAALCKVRTLLPQVSVSLSTPDDFARRFLCPRQESAFFSKGNIDATY